MCFINEIEFGITYSQYHLILFPGSLEVHRSIFPELDKGPPSPSTVHVSIDMKRADTVHHDKTQASDIHTPNIL